MKIAEFIKGQILMPRLQRNGVLVVYDLERRYRQLCLGLAGDGRQVIDATENSIESRDSALKALMDLGATNTDTTGLIVYVPARTPISDEERQRDPSALYVVCGSVFPEGDGDEYLSLCLKAKPDHATEIRAIFDKDSNPGFAVIDAVGGGLGWPHLRTLLRADEAESVRN